MFPNDKSLFENDEKKRLYEEIAQIMQLKSTTMAMVKKAVMKQC